MERHSVSISMDTVHWFWIIVIFAKSLRLLLSNITHHTYTSAHRPVQPTRGNITIYKVERSQKLPIDNPNHTMAGQHPKCQNDSASSAAPNVIRSPGLYCPPSTDNFGGVRANVDESASQNVLPKPAIVSDRPKFRLRLVDIHKPGEWASQAGNPVEF